MAGSSVSAKIFEKSICSRCGRLLVYQWALRVGDRLFHTRCDDQHLQFFQGMTDGEFEKKDITCYECQQLVTEEKYKRIGERPYHDKCLNCAKCRRPFTDVSCYQVNEKYYCCECHWTSRTDELFQSDETQESGECQ